MNASSRFQLNSRDWLRIGKGALLAAAGAVAAYFATEVLPTLDHSTMLGASIAAIASTLLNLVRKWLADSRPAH